MDEQRQEQLDELARMALELPEDRRGALLEELCEDEGLRREVLEALARGYRPAALPDPDRPDLPGTAALREVVGRLARRATSERYEVLGPLGAGGQGEILEVRDRDLERVLAMKVMHQEGGLRDGQPTPSASHLGATRVLDEARVAARLDHPGVVPVHELGLDADGRLYFTMKRVDGQTLARLLQEDRSGDQLVSRVEVLRRVCEAMAYAHDKGVIHRDLNPGNVMVGRFGVVYVMDWGVARAGDLPDPHDLRPDPRAAAEAPDLLTVDGRVVGTPPFMSPEQAAGRTGSMGPATDVYAVGAMLYQLLGGRKPYVGAGEQPRALDVLERIQAGPPEPVERLAADAPPELLSICRRAMAREPQERYPDMLSLGADLTAWLEGRVVAAHATGTWAETRSWVRRHRPLAAALAAVLLLSLGFALTTAVLNRELGDSNAALRLREGELQASNAELRDREGALEAANAELRQREEELETSNGELRTSNRDMQVVDTWRELERLAADLDDLWPARRATVPALEDWLARSQRALARLEDGGAGPGLRRDHEQLLGRALPGADPAAQLASLARLDQLEARAAQYAQLLDLWTRPQELTPELRSQLLELAHESREHEATLAAHRAEHRRRFRPRFEAPDDTLRHERFVDLFAAAARHVDPQTGWRHGLVPGHGPGVVPRLERARTVRERTVSNPDAAARWDKARQSVADHPAYGGLDLAPVTGLLPLGPDPDSGLWEFWHPASGSEPGRDAAGRLTVDGTTGLVFVLIPGGSFLMGAQASDAKDPGFDPDALTDEFPPHDVQLAPYLLSKYELTQGQWRRLAGDEPSQHSRWHYAERFEREFGASYDPDRHPVDSVSWIRARRVLGWHGLDLPSEAQWEFAYRATTVGPWVFGPDERSLTGHANLADRWMADHGALPDAEVLDWLDDGFAVHAAVGRFAPNGFGLHDMAGNVWEWCRDLYQDHYFGRSEDNTPIEPKPTRGWRCNRGGSFVGLGGVTRSSARNFALPDHVEDDQGLRPVWELPRP